MENSMLSLFGDDSFQEQKQDKKSVAKKKSGKKSAPVANSMFSFEENEAAPTQDDAVLTTTNQALQENESTNEADKPGDKNVVTADHEIAEQELEHEIPTATFDNAINEQEPNLEIDPKNQYKGPQDLDNNADTPALPNELEVDVLNDGNREELDTHSIASNENNQEDSSTFENDALTQQYLGALVEAGIDMFQIERLSTKTNNNREEKQEPISESLDNDVNKAIEVVQQTNDIHFDISPTEASNDVPALPAWHLTKQYYTIGEVANLFQVNTSHIRFWSKEFKFKLRTNRKGDRHYTVDDINKLRVIYDLVKIKKHTIKGAREKLLFEKKQVIQHISLKEQLKDLQQTLQHLKNTIS